MDGLMRMKIWSLEVVSDIDPVGHSPADDWSFTGSGEGDLLA